MRGASLGPPQTGKLCSVFVVCVCAGLCASYPGLSLSSGVWWCFRWSDGSGVCDSCGLMVLGSDDVIAKVVQSPAISLKLANNQS